MILRIEGEKWKVFFAEMTRRSDVETAGLLLARPLVPGGEVLLVDAALAVPDDAYTIRRVDQLQLDPVVLNRLVRPARASGLSVFTVHTHGPSVPSFSWADDRGDTRLMPALHAQIQAPVHGSIVLVPDGRLSARAFGADGAQHPVSVRIVGRSISMPSVPETPSDAFFDRQRLAIGLDGQARLQAARVGVVGLGGTGSVTAAQLLHLGIGGLVLMDGDVVERSNVSRVIGARRDDVGVTAKVDVALRYARASGLPADIVAQRIMLGSELDIVHLMGCDVIMSCVDRFLPRALLNRLAYEAAIPLIDMGTAFRIEDDRLVAAAGRVVVVGPGRPCLACWGHIDPVALRNETLADPERESLEREGYVQGASIHEPSVMPFNVQVAGAAVEQVLRILAGFAAVEAPAQLAFNFIDGTVRRNSLARGGACTICGKDLQASGSQDARISARC
jgi:hypothetical protein